MLMLALDDEGPLYRQIYRALRAAILAGRLEPGTRLSSSRDLALELGVSRNTVLQAVEQLLAEGYLSASRGRGTFVAASITPTGPNLPKAARDARPQLSAVGRRLRERIPPRAATWSLRREPLAFDFRYGEPAYSELPLEVWSRLVSRRARRLSARQLAYQPPGGALDLRNALSDYLARSRGVVCDPEQVLIVQGSQQAIDLTVRLLIDPGDVAVLEEPHYTGFSFCLAAAGASTVAIPTDAEGLQVDALAGVPEARLACVTPSHQFPSGGVLSLARRFALLEWATQRDAYVLEDDYDGEFRYEGRPVQCLQSLDRDGRVIYVGTASKVLFPALRIGWIVVPPELVGPFRDAKAIADTGTASLEQFAFADFIREGHLDRHVWRARKRHASRRRALLEAVERDLAGLATIVGTDAGIHVLLRFESLAARFVTPLRAACRARGVGVYPAAHYYASPPEHAELLLGYASLSEDDIRAGVRELKSALDSIVPPRIGQGSQS